jgi:exopolysaccharide biosynthesis protein
MNKNNYSGGRSSRPRGGVNNFFDEPHKKSVSGSRKSGGYKNAPKRRLPLWILIAADILAAALLLGIFYISNYEMQGETEGVVLPTPTPTEVVLAPSPSNGADPAQTPGETAPGETATAAPVDPGDWRAKFADKFTDGEVEKTENSYKSANINISIEKVNKDGSVYFIADIYVADLKYFKSAFAKKSDVMGGRALTDKVAKENNAILAINGDHCVDNEGTVVRNGKLFRKPKSSLDVLVMNYDGSMQTFSPQEYDVEKTLADGVWQVWSFGPMLLKDGQPLTKFNSTMQIGGENPRTAVGYFEPGHYCFVVVDGRQSGYSKGFTLTQLSQLFADLGCSAAYNMDGGRSAEMAFMGKVFSHPMDGRRSTTDILYIGE